MGRRKRRHLQEFCKINFAFTKSVDPAGGYLARNFFLRPSMRALFFYRRVFPSSPELVMDRRCSCVVSLEISRWKKCISVGAPAGGDRNLLLGGRQGFTRPAGLPSPDQTSTASSCFTRRAGLPPRSPGTLPSRRDMPRERIVRARESRERAFAKSNRTRKNANSPLGIAKFSKMQNCWRGDFVNFGKNQECKTHM